MSAVSCQVLKDQCTMTLCLAQLHVNPMVLSQLSTACALSKKAPPCNQAPALLFRRLLQPQDGGWMRSAA